MSQLIRDAVGEHHIRMVVFTTDSKDGIISKKNALNIYVIGDGQMGYGDFGIFTYEVQDLIKRKAEYYACVGKTTMDYVNSLNGVIAYG